MKKIHKLLSVLLFAGLSVISCKNNFSDFEYEVDNELTNEKAYLSFGINESKERMAAPDPLTWAEVNSIELKKDDSLLKTWTAAEEDSAYEQMKADTSVVLDAGTYTFEVLLKDADGDILQTGKLENEEIKAGDNLLNFETKALLEGKGILSINCYVECPDWISSIKIYLNDEFFDSIDSEWGFDENPISLSPKEVDCGNYILKIELYNGDEELLEKTTEFIEIQNKRETVFNYNFYDRTDVYPVEFVIEDGIQDYPAVIFTDDVDIKAYTADRTLPSPDKIVNKPEGLEFFGWYNDQSISITELPEHANGKVTVVARFGKSVTSADEIDGSTCNYKITPENDEDWESIYTKLKDDSSKTVSLDLSKVTDLTDTSTYFGSSFYPTLTGIVFPASVETISDDSFQNNGYLESVEFAQGSNLTTIGNYAFSCCYALREIIIPKSVTTIGEYTFEYCEALKKVTFEADSDLTAIGSGAFQDCYSLEEIVIPAKTQSIGSATFYDCFNLKEVMIPADSELTAIRSNAFQFCYSLEEIFIPSTADFSNSEGVFCYCTSLKKVILEGDSVITSIPFSAFESCYSLEEFVIPSSVTKIGSFAFDECTSLKSITIPSNVETIGERAFCDCTNLAAVTFDNDSNLTEISDNAFENCTSLTEIVIPQSVTDFGWGVFDGCYNLKNFTVPDTIVSNLDSFIISDEYNFKVIVTERTEEVDYIEAYYFSECVALREVIIPASVKDIRSSAFCNCTNLKTVTFTGDSNLEMIGEYAFGDCTSLTDFVIPEGVGLIAESAFVECTSLTSINIPSSVETIGEGAFNGCTNLAVVTFENNSSLTSIPESAFKYCSSLEEIVIPSSVTGIGSFAFQECTSLTSIVIPSSVTIIGSYAFVECTSLTSINIPSSVETIGEGAFNGCTNLAGVTFDNDSNLTEISDNAFENCTSLTEIVIPQSVTDFGWGVFDGCNNLKNFTVPDTIVWNLNNFITSDECNFKVIVTERTEEVDYIEAYYFSECEAIREVVIPASVKDIHSSAFYNCTNLKTVTFTGDSNLEMIRDSAFGDCTSLTDFVIPEGVGLIAESAFAGCTSLTSITIPSSVNMLEQNAFAGCNNLKTVAFENNSSLTSIPESAFKYCSSLEEIVIPSSVTGIGSFAFQECTSLTSISIPSSVETIGEGAFNGCTNLAVVTFENDSNLTEIDYNAFKDCSSLTEIVIPQSVTDFGWNVFEGCSNLKNFTVPDTIVSTLNSLITSDEYNFKVIVTERTEDEDFIENNYFLECEALREVIIPASVKDIRSSAFFGCTNLKTVTFAEGSLLERIESQAFEDCTSLTEINIPSGVIIAEDAFEGCSYQPE